MFGQSAFDLDWIKSFQGDHNEYVYDFVVDPSGAAIVVGTFQSEVNFGTDALPFIFNAPAIEGSKPNADSFIAKYDSEGELVWVKQLGGAGNQIISSIELDLNGNILVAGSISADTDFNFAAAASIQLVSSAKNAFIAKYDANANFLWCTSAGGSGYSEVYHLVLDSEGNACAAGNFGNFCDFGAETILNSQGLHGDLFAWRVSSNGTPVSAFRLGGAGMESLRDLEINSNGHVFIAAEYSNKVANVGFDLDPSSNVVLSDIKGAFVIEIAPNDSLIHHHLFGDPDINSSLYIWLQSIAIIDDSLFVCGSLSDVATFDFDTSTGTNTMDITPNGQTGWVSKYAPSGLYQSTKLLSNVQNVNIFIWDLISYESGYVLVIGFNGNLDINPGDEATQIYGPPVEVATCLIVLDNAFGYLDYQLIDGTGWVDIRHAEITNQNEIYVAGDFTATLSVNDEISFESNSFYSDGLLMKYNPCEPIPFYLDEDGDGFGGQDTLWSCYAVPGYSSNGGDCDDANAVINPTITEICNGIDDNCNGLMDEGFDLDNDTYTSCDGDCDDTNANVYPGAPEINDGIDNDCDLSIDEDLDGDGQTEEEGDCDDTNNNMYLGNIEICDGFDNNCNGLTDEGFDLDNDSFTTCEGDCDDQNPSVFPGAPELLDGLDNDCDLDTDENLDLDGDGQTEEEGDCDDNDPNVFWGNTEVCDGIDNNCDGNTDEGFDMDDDGFTTCEGDCDDNAPLVHPSMDEVCNTIDDNCNGLIDENLNCTDAPFFIPEGISPNGDGINDAWYLDFLVDKENYTVSVFNRWGQRVHFQENTYTAWDGKYNGEPMVNGDYYYLIEMGAEQFRGILTITY